MTPSKSTAEPKLARELFETYDGYRLKEVVSRRFTQADVLRWLKQLSDRKAFEMIPVGRSGEGRTIQLLRLGQGSVKVLLWSQMHGDEPTATMGLLDMLNFFALNPSHKLTAEIHAALTLLIIPMLNPDGAERFQRRTAQLLDMNRDALALQTPEANLLKSVRAQYQPDFGFNLHDQDPRYTVGATKNVAAFSMLAPAMDEARTDNHVRARAKRVASVFTEVLLQFIPGHVSKYDDTFEPRAFGDSVQRWGTSTVLVESGGWPGDPEKMFLRKLDCVGLLTTLYAIATGSYQSADSSVYERLPFSTKNLYDIIIRGAKLKANATAPAATVDAGLNVEEQVDASTGATIRVARLVDIGDLSTFGAFEEIDAKGALLDADRVVLDRLMVPVNQVRDLLLSK